MPNFPDSICYSEPLLQRSHFDMVAFMALRRGSTLQGKVFRSALRVPPRYPPKGLKTSSPNSETGLFSCQDLTQRLVHLTQCGQRLLEAREGVHLIRYEESN